MTLAEASAADAVTVVEVDQPGRWRRARLPLGVCVVVAGLALLPLIKNRIFYFWDDSAAVFVPSWRYMGSQLLAGHFPVLAHDLWMGGNISAEAQLSLWNPAMLLNDVFVALMPDLAVAATVVKIQFLVLLALGTYLLCREYGARPGASAAVAVLLPFAGFTLYFDAAAWAISMISFAFVPHLWWSARRCARGRLNPIVPVFFGFMAMTAGSPYGALGVVMVLAVVIAERLLLREWSGSRRLVLIGVAVAITGVVVYLPLVLAGEVTFRDNTHAHNVGYMVTALGDLFNLSSPTYLPHVPANQFDHLTVPYAFLGWFVLPLAPWLAWSTLKVKVRARSALLIFGGSYVLATTGPTELWLFRWPMRLVDYPYLPVCVLLAIVLSAGLRTDYLGRRVLGSALLIGVQAVLAWSATPEQRYRHLAAALLLGALVAAVVVVAKRNKRFVPGVLVLGTAVTLFTELMWYPDNAAATAWNMPHNMAELHSRFDRYTGNTFTVANVGFQDPQANPQGAWKDMLAGSMYAAAGVHSVNSYTGIGFVPFMNALCLGQSGASCADSYRRLWEIQPATGTSLADLLRLETVVVHNGYLPGNTSVGTPPPGWRILSRDDQATVLRRIDPLPWPDGTVSWTAPGLTVTADHQLPLTGEELRYRGGGRVVLAGLAWPGMTASVNGVSVPVRIGTAGLMTLDLPQAPQGATLEVSFEEPGFSYGVPLLIGGLLLGLLHSGAYWYVRRRRGGPGNLPDELAADLPEPAGGGPALERRSSYPQATLYPQATRFHDPLSVAPGRLGLGSPPWERWGMEFGYLTGDLVPAHAAVDTGSPRSSAEMTTTALSQLNRSSVVLRSNSPYSARRAGLARASRRASANSTGCLGGTSQPVSPLVTISGTPPTSVATTAAPRAAASSTVPPRPSVQLGLTNTVQVAISRSAMAWSTAPRKMTWSVRRSSRTCSRSAAWAGPSPQIRTRTTWPLSRSMATAVSMSAVPLPLIRRPTKPSVGGSVTGSEHSPSGSSMPR
jgi:hypothetical protein